MVFCEIINQTSKPIILPKLPYDIGALSPYITIEAMEYHLKHHNAYVDRSNLLLQELEDLKNNSLEDIILYAHNKKDNLLFNNAAQIWNHSFFFHSMKQNGGGMPNDNLLTQIIKDFTSFELFEEEFRKQAIGLFGSGWVWLIYENNKLSIMTTINAEVPIVKSIFPIIACDVWEHAYYIDYRNVRNNFITAFMKNLINWEFASKNFANAIQFYN
jgi:Fe-Mn family superoxide dismutase